MGTKLKKEQNNSPTKNNQEQSIVIVDDAPDNLRLIVSIFKKQNYKVRPASSGKRALATIRKQPPDLILLDIMMPDINGYEVCKQLKADKKTKDIPIIFLSALNEVFDKVKAFQAGGVDYISKPFQVEELLIRVNTHLTLQRQQKELSLQNEKLKAKNAFITKQAKKLELLAIKDFLTKLSNRRNFLKKAKMEKNRFQRTHNCFSIIMLDIDRFKHVNDTYSHECGDNVLIGISRILEKSLRSHDIVARWGGEEFICLLPGTDRNGAKNVAEKIRTKIGTSAFQCNDDTVFVTATLGICLYDGSCSLDTCINRADEALYKGKRQGRNQVNIWNRITTIKQGKKCRKKK